MNMIGNRLKKDEEKLNLLVDRFNALVKKCKEANELVVELQGKIDKMEIENITLKQELHNLNEKFVALQNYDATVLNQLNQLYGVKGKDEEKTEQDKKKYIEDITDMFGNYN